MDRKKELKEQYQNRTVTGGVYRIACAGSGRSWLKATKNLQEQQNRFRFFVMTNTAPEPAMRPDWDQYGGDSFSLTVLEPLEKKDDQTDAAYARDIDTLLDLWKAKEK